MSGQSGAWMIVTGPAKIVTPSGLTYLLGGTQSVRVPTGSTVGAYPADPTPGGRSEA